MLKPIYQIRSMVGGDLWVDVEFTRYKKECQMGGQSRVVYIEIDPPSIQKEQEILFVLEGLPVYRGDKVLHVHNGKQEWVTAEFHPLDVMSVMVRQENGSVPAVLLANLHWPKKRKEIGPADVNIKCEVNCYGGVKGICYLPVARVEQADDGSLTVVTTYWPSHAQ